MAVEFDRENISSGYNPSKMNNNFIRIETALQDALSRSGVTPNTMEADLDMNSNDILNASTIQTDTLVLDGVPISPTVPTGIDTNQLIPYGKYTSFATRTEAINYSPSTALDFIQTEGYNSIGDGGGATYKKVLSEPSHAGKFQTVGGVWYELYENIVTPQMFGAKGDGVTSDHTAFKNAEVFGRRIFVPAGDYYFDKTWNVHKPIMVEGAAGMHVVTGNYPSRLIFADGIVGVLFHRSDTDADDAGVPVIASSGGADGSIFSNLHIMRGSGTLQRLTATSTKHGVWLKCHVRLENLRISGFHGDGCHIVARAGDSDPYIRGNANHFVLDTVRCDNNSGRGLYVNGADANAGSVWHYDATSNGSWGLWDNSFLGNDYTGTSHYSGNGVFAYCEYGGNWYYTIDDTLASTTEPGTDGGTVWVLLGPGSPTVNVPTWVSGTWFVRGGPIHLTNPNARGLLADAYTESNQVPSRVLTPWMVLNGQHAAAFTEDSTAGRLSVELGEFRSSRPIQTRQIAAGVTRVAKLGGPGTRILGFSKSDISGDGEYNLRYTGEDLTLGYGDLAANVILAITGAATTVQFGRTSTVPYALNPVNFALGTGVNARIMTYGSAAPTTGDHAQGEIVWNRSQAIGSPIGWACTVTGTPGTWVAMANL